ncbi:DNA-binding MarR family transcriptional regulator [Propionibacteriaceae bacterium ES.041]|nr:DNA-binding MarR family transcriptional regulator [Propionibacteriaceae bacterium ES.041]
MPDDPDLGALLAALFPRLIAMEEPILAAAGLSMWEYTIATELAAAEALSQVELSRRTRRDPTRLGKHLDELESRGLVSRERSADQRQRTVRLTRAGDKAYATAKRRIRAAEDELLAAELSAADVRRLRQLLTRLTRSSGSRKLGGAHPRDR